MKVRQRREPLLRLGRWEDADRLSVDALAVEPEGIFAATLLEVRSEIAAVTGRYDDAEQLLERSRVATSGETDDQFRFPATQVAAVVARGRGDLLQGLGLIKEVFGDGAESGYTARYTWPVLCEGLRLAAALLVAAQRRAPRPPRQHGSCCDNSRCRATRPGGTGARPSRRPSGIDARAAPYHRPARCVGADRTQTSGVGPGGGGPIQSADPLGTRHQREDGECPRLQCPGKAVGRQPR